MGDVNIWRYKVILITNDLFDIASRLRSVNDSYRLYYNTQNHRYEVHNAATDALEFVLPYDELDARSVEYARYTSVTNAETLFEEIERNNAKVEKQMLADIAENAACSIEKGERHDSK